MKLYKIYAMLERIIAMHSMSNSVKKQDLHDCRYVDWSSGKPYTIYSMNLH